MGERFKAMGNPECSDTKFMTEIVAQILDYAVDNGLNPTDTVMIIADNLLVLAEISNFDNWERRKKDGDTNE